MQKLTSMLLCIFLLASLFVPVCTAQAAALPTAAENPPTAEEQAALHELFINNKPQPTLQPETADKPADDGTGRRIVSSEIVEKQFCADASELTELVGASMTQQLRTVLYNAIMQAKTEVDLSAYNLTYSKALSVAVLNMISTEFFEALHFKAFAFNFYTDDYSIVSIEFAYDCTKTEFEQKLRAAKAAAQSLVSGIQGNTNLTDVQKALLLHDRLVLHCEYGDVNADTKLTSNMYAALVLRTPVCQGYAEAYAYLLKCVGIRSEIASSKTLNHAWNIVYIDNKPYHVDVTWDDPTRDVSGRVYHYNFLVSTDELRNGDEPHIAYDYPDSPTDTTYDDYFWEESETAFVLLNNEVYYINTVNATLNRMSDHATICSVKNYWWLNTEGHYLIGNRARLGVVNNTLFVSMSNALYTVNLETGSILPKYVPNLVINGNEFYCIYGFYHANGVFTFDFVRLNNDEYEFARTTEIYKRGTSFVLGDVDGTETVSASDARLVLRAAVGLDSFTIEQNTAADLDFDGTVSSSDARLVLRYSVALESFTYDPTQPDEPDVPITPEPEPEPHKHNYVDYYCSGCASFQPGKFRDFLIAYILDNYTYTTDDLYYVNLTYEAYDENNNLFEYYTSYVYDAQSETAYLMYSSYADGIFFSNILMLPADGESSTDGAFIVEDAATEETIYYAEYICPNANFVEGISIKLTYTEGEQYDPATISSLISDCTYLSVLLLYNHMQDLGYNVTPTDLGFPMILD